MRTAAKEHSLMSDDPFLIAFGALDWLAPDNQRHYVSGPDLFRELTARGVWFTSKPIMCRAGTPVMFYLKGTGVFGLADIDRVSPAASEDSSVLTRYGIEYFRTKLCLSNVRRIDPAVDLRPLVPRLTFLTNKGSHWGTGLQATPRRIPRNDFDLILSVASSDVPAS
jgi:hypothetical protein